MAEQRGGRGGRGAGLGARGGRLLNTLLISAHDGHDKVFDLAAIKRESEMINEAIAFAVTFKRQAYARSFGLLPPTDGS